MKCLYVCVSFLVAVWLEGDEGEVRAHNKHGITYLERKLHKMDSNRR